MVETLVTDIPDALQDRIRQVLDRACGLERMLATAESCTGGLVASLFTDVEGSSHAFDRGYVVYTDRAKADMLGVPPDLLNRHGAVSRPVAIAMADGTLDRSAAHVAFSVTGLAGPAGGAEEGLVHFGCAVRNRKTLHREEHFGSIGRSGVRLACLQVAVEMFEEGLE